MRILPVVLCLALASSFFPRVVVAAGAWETHLDSQPEAPQLFIGIDKHSQTFYLFEHKSPLAVRESFPCATGEQPGDKTREGDKRTPEGVYFVQGRVPGRLDYELYGDSALSLDFPNPVDRLKGKTGHGIWIHGRGKSLNHDTRGCVALAANDMESVAGGVPPGTPVVIAGKLTWDKGRAEDDTAKLLAERVRQWADDWEHKRPRFFDYFDPEKFARTEGVNFATFKERKLDLFAREPWIEIMVDDVRVLKGPDYWVTTFDQFYRTRGLVSAMGKRLYWQKDPDGVWRIVGGEYVKAAPGLAERFLASKRPQVKRMLTAWMRAWLKADLDVYMAFYAPDAVSGAQHGAEAIRAYKKALWTTRTPTHITADKIDIALHKEGLTVSFVQTYSDSLGHSDKGVKTLVLEPKGDDWIIVSERWIRE